MDPWTVVPAERARHLEQFRTLNPVGGLLTGDQAKGFLLQSGLPPPVLGQIWALADVNCDGKMDLNEFSVACKLITMKLRGVDVPPALPPGLKAVLAGTGQTTPISPAGSGIMPIRPGLPPGAVPMPGMATPPMVPMSMPATVGMGGIPQQMPGMPPQMQGIPNAGIIMPGGIPPVMHPSSLSLSGTLPGVRPVVPVQDMHIQRAPSVTSQDSVSSPLMEWAVPNPSRLKYTQMFNQNDRSKSGYLTGVQARNILLGSGLPQPILAQVWGLSDIDADGRLSCEEFILAMHLCDVARQVGKLPPKLNLDLIPPSFRTGSRKQSIKSVPGSSVVSGSNTPIMEPEAITSPGGTVTFEDRRKENYDKGQAELDRRRKVLTDMQNRERDERERKERDDFERKEKQRLEIERRQQDERDRQMAMQKEMEERRMEDFKKKEEEKEAARREMERQRKVEMEENKRQELLAHRQKEQEEVLRLKGVNHGLGLELSSLVDIVKDLSGKITETRVGVSSVKSEIDGMRSKRDGFMTEMGMLKGQLKDQNNRMLMAAQEKVRLEKQSSESEVKNINLKQLREKAQNLNEELAKKQSDSDTAGQEVSELKSTLSTLIESCKAIYDEYRDKREKVLTGRKKHIQEFNYNAAWGDHSTTAVDAGSGVIYYRALFDFEGRNADELTFSTGAIIQKDDAVPDPGWLSGTLDGHSGWFPESFVEIVPANEIESTAPAPAPAPAGGGDTQAYDTGGSDYYVAMYPYESHEAGDLPFDVGEIVFVTHKEGEWWTGQIGDRSGIFPANYVTRQDEVTGVDSTANVVSDMKTSNYAPSGFSDSEPSKIELEPYEEAEIKREISEFTKAPPKSPKSTTKTKKYEIGTVLANYQATSENQLSLTRGQLITVRKRNTSGWWEGELQAKGKKRQLGWFPGSYVKVLGPGGGSRQSSSRTTPIPFDEIEMPMMDAPVYNEAKEQVIALYPYTAQNSDELTFVKDDVISIISKDEPDWWRGQIGTAVGLFPTNYVQPLSASNQDNQFDNSSNNYFEDDFNNRQVSEDWDQANADNGVHADEWWPSPQTPGSRISSVSNGSAGSGYSQGAKEGKRQESIHELIITEENYMADMNIVKECFMMPLYKSGLLTHDELTAIFINWDDLMDCSNKLLKAFTIRKRTCENGVILMIGDIICQHMPAMITYIRFCSAQLRSASIIQLKTEKSSEFRDFCKRCQSNPKTMNLPLSSFLIKPMQRITKYPLLLKKILEYTPENHPDHQNLEEALSKAEELCAQVNEGVREKENSDRLEWMQTHITCEGLEERLIFNSLTNALGPRKFIHHGTLKKTKSGKELVGFMFNDFLLLAQPSKPLNDSQFSFDRNKHMKFKIYRKPIFLNEINVEDEGVVNENEFIIGSDSNKHLQMYVLASGASEKRLWMKSIKEGKKRYHQIEQQYLQRRRSKKVNAVGRLLVVVMEGESLPDRSKSARRRPMKGKLRVVVVGGVTLANRDPNGKSDPYCEVSLGSEIRRTRVIRGTLNPKWNDSMQFSVKDLHEDILCLTVYDKDYFSPNQFLGRTEIGISTIFELTRNEKTPLTRKFPLHEVESGEIVIKLHLQIFEK